MVELIGQLLKLGVLILGEWFQAKKLARERQERVALDNALFEQLVTNAMTRLRAHARRESDQAQNVEDRIDGDK